MIRSNGFIAIILTIGIATGCVSIGPKNSAPQRNSDVRFKAPNSKFRALDTDSADATWISPSSGNIISYQSNCNELSDPSLGAMLTNATNGIQDQEVLLTESFPFNGRTALRRKLKGTLDGVEVQLDLVALKKNRCNYIFTYVGLPGNANKDQNSYENFLKGFRAP